LNRRLCRLGRRGAGNASKPNAEATAASAVKLKKSRRVCMSISNQDRRSRADAASIHWMSAALLKKHRHATRLTGAPVPP
jgi:hypothetical protein